jgi:hypothetical protein
MILVLVVTAAQDIPGLIQVTPTQAVEQAAQAKLILLVLPVAALVVLEITME